MSDHCQPPHVPSAIPYPLTGQTPADLHDRARRLLDQLTGRPPVTNRDAERDAWAQCVDLGRELAGTADPTHRHRTVLIGGDRAALLAELRALVTAGPADQRPHARDAGGLAFLFSGQSSQRAGMGRQLHRVFPTFARTFDELCADLDQRPDQPLDRPLREVAFGEPGSPEAALLDQPEYSQPALLAFEIALFRLLDRLGVRPAYVTGHSFGEVVAACAAGVWSSSDACSVVTTRARLLTQVPPGGAMVAIEQPEAEVAARLAETAGGVVIAAVHGPGAVVISGLSDAVLDVASHYAASGVRTTRINISNGFHSPRVDPVLDRLADALRALPAAPTRIPLVCNATGTLADPQEPATAEYWVRQCRGPVRFLDVMRTLCDAGVRAFLEIGPSGVLSRIAANCVDEADAATVVPAVRAEPDELTALLTALARLDAVGHPVDWAAYYAESSPAPLRAGAS